MRNKRTRTKNFSAFWPSANWNGSKKKIDEAELVYATHAKCFYNGTLENYLCLYKLLSDVPLMNSSLD